MIPLIKSRNFNSHEIAHRGAKNAVHTDEQVFMCGYQMGYLQAARDSVSKHFPEFEGFTITSGNRDGYNHTIEGAADDSFHIWRVEKRKKTVITANDFRPVGIPMEAAYNHLIRNFRGEIYWNKKKDILHLAPVAIQDEHWIQ